MEGIRKRRVDKKEIFRLATLLEFGFYIVSREGRFLECDDKARKIFHIPLKNCDLSKYSIKNIFILPQEREHRIKKLLENQCAPLTSAINAKIKGKSVLILDICWCCSEMFEEQPCFIGLVKGLESKTISSKMHDTFPQGIFELDNEGGIIRANRNLLNILNYPDESKLLGLKFESLCSNKENLKRLNSKIESQGSGREVLEMKDYYDEIKEVECFSQAIQEFGCSQWGIISDVGNREKYYRAMDSAPIGRRGTIRDISHEIKLQAKVTEAENSIKKITSDINNLIHTFLHPVVAFSGNSELIHFMGKTLHKTIQEEIFIHSKLEEDTRKLGEKLMSRLNFIKDNLPDSNDEIPFSRLKKQSDIISKHKSFTINDFKKKMGLMVNLLEFSLNSRDSKTTQDGAIRDTALWLLDELIKIDYENHEVLKYYLNKEFVNFLQNILFSYMNKGTKLLVDETKIMKREVEAFRRFLGLQPETKYVFVESDVGMIAENALELFKPVFAEAGLEVHFKRSGNLMAPVSLNDIDRVFCNLYQNARKYSKIGRAKFVNIVLREMGNINQIEFSIVNLGLPIKKEEIENDAIWQSGYRSELAKKSDRDGTGTGLADAYEVINAHNGEISISSTPTKGETDPPEYKVPYKTKIIIRLPKTRACQKRKKHERI